MSHILTFQGKEFDIRTYTAGDVEEVATLFAEPVVLALEECCRSRRGISVGEYVDLAHLYDAFRKTFTGIIDTIALSIGAQYLHRVTAVLPALTDQLCEARTHGSVEDRVDGITTSSLALSIVKVLLDSQQPSRHIRSYLRSPVVASTWAALHVEQGLVLLESPNWKSNPPTGVAQTFGPSTWDLAEVLKTLLRFIVLGKPLSRSLGGDGRSCLPPASRMRLETALTMFRAGGHHTALSQPADVDRLDSLLATLQHMRSQGYTFVRKLHALEKTKAGWNICSYCKNHGVVGTCGKCTHARYCSRRCQREDWATDHRNTCLTIDYSALHQERGIKSRHSV